MEAMAAWAGEAGKGQGMLRGSLSGHSRPFHATGVLPHGIGAQKGLSTFAGSYGLILPCLPARGQLCRASPCCGLAFAVELRVLCRAASSPGQPAGLDEAGGKERFIAGEVSLPLFPLPSSSPHLYSSPQGGGGSRYWSWEHFICKCLCV